jgi:beta-1,4-mannosyltransferase
MHVVVIVLGDLGRSPRMQYHALSLLQAGHFVSLIGYEGEDLIPALYEFSNEQLGIIRFKVPSPRLLQKVMPVYFVWRIFSLTVWSLFALLSVHAKRKYPIDCILVQNPPALPLLSVAYTFCWILRLLQGKRACLIIDWHNIGYSMLKPGGFQILARTYERIMAPLADGHFTVTKAMKNFLHATMNIPDDANLRVLYDCPPDMFQPISFEQQYDILYELDKKFCEACPRFWYASKDPECQSMFIEKLPNGDCRPRKGRPALITSSTSWTADEDFGILLAALILLDDRIKSEKSSLKVMVAVTGKGPQKAAYEEKISQLSLEFVAIQTLWLKPENYPKLIACADFGVSLHTSTSGLDLPMKILDLYGCEVPVCAADFECLPELVLDDRNGRVFRSHEELADQFWELLHPLTQVSSASCHGFGTLERYSRTLRGRKRWAENWTSSALPVISLAVSKQE